MIIRTNEGRITIKYAFELFFGSIVVLLFTGVAVMVAQCLTRTGGGF